jgi:single-stranded-DNA-specific exonuclease
VSIRTFPGRRWMIAPSAPAELLEALRIDGVDPVVAQVLYGRGHDSRDKCHRFLRGAFASPPKSSGMAGLGRAVERILHAVEHRECIGIHGDFDLDGITSTAVLYETLTSLGSSPLTRVPNRFSDGYGLNQSGVDHLIDAGASLLIAVDCGVSSVAEIAHARRRGVDVIVVDHHTVPSVKPDAIAILNPRQTECDYPFKHLAAVGVTFRLCQALLSAAAGSSPIDTSLEERLLELVALGTVADVVPLIDENRALVAQGLRALVASRRPGLAALLRRSGAQARSVDVDWISYTIAPRLNAAGRLGDASISLRLLLTDDRSEADSLAEQMEGLNRERQELTDIAVREARRQVDQAPPTDLAFAASSEFSIGIIGLVASRLAEEFRRSAIVVGIGPIESRGSIRSSTSLDAVSLLAQAEDLLERYGGHQRAAGFSVRTTDLPALRERLEQMASAQLKGQDNRPRLEVDGEIALAGVDSNLPRRLIEIGPFGQGNPNPVFVSRQLRVIGARTVGRSGPDHLKLRVHDGRQERDAIAFGLGFALPDIIALKGGYIDVAHAIEMNTWNGTESMQLRVLDWQPSQVRR